jgi:hypothetical protein
LAEDRIGDRINVDGGEEEDVRLLEERITEGIRSELKPNEVLKFHGVEMVKRHARGFLDEEEIDVYQFSGEHEYYKHILEKVYRPMAEERLINEYENNNFEVPLNSRLRENF